MTRPEAIEFYSEKIRASGNEYWLDEQDSGDEYAHFYFLLDRGGQPVLADVMLYTLRLHHESELMEIAEAQVAEQFPGYDADQSDPKLDEQVAQALAEAIVDLQEEDEVKVQEFIEEDEGHEWGLGIDAALHVPVISPTQIQRFIDRYRVGELETDPELYSFQIKSDFSGE
ncbi:MAG: hypothetical protein ACK5DD_14215 [Cyclobacteriaceae bacterium]|jgi:hypothetical protein